MTAVASDALIVTAHWRCGTLDERKYPLGWLARVIDGDRIVYQMHLGTSVHRNYVIQTALASRPVGEARAAGRPVYVRSEKEQEAIDDE